MEHLVEGDEQQERTDGPLGKLNEDFVFIKMGHPGLFFFILSFQYTVDSKQMFNININFCR